MTYGWSVLITQDLRDKDLDAIWTPGAFLGEFGLQVDSKRGFSEGLVFWLWIKDGGRL